MYLLTSRDFIADLKFKAIAISTPGTTAIFQAKSTSKIQKDIPAAQIVDLSFLRNVQQELKLR